MTQDRLQVVLAVVMGSAICTTGQAEDKLQDRFDRLAAEVGPVVGIELNAKVTAERISYDEYRSVLRSQLEVLLPKDKRHGLLHSWQLLGLLPAEKLDFEVLIGLTASATGAAYNPATKTIQVTPVSEMSLGDESVFHELVHAVQDQRHDLKRTHEQLQTIANTDALIAFKFLLEGEAVFWPTLYRRKMALEQAVYLSPQSQSEVFGDEDLLTSQEIVRNFDLGAHRDPRLKALASTMKLLPPLMVRSLSLPYSKGDNAVLRILKRGGRQGLRQSFEDVASLNTRDLLFPDPGSEELRDVTELRLPAIKEKLGDSWKLKHEDTLGALLLNTMFEHRKVAAVNIARSWNGDRVQLWEDGDDGVALLGLAEFDDANAAALFHVELTTLCREKWMRGKTIRELRSDGGHLVSDDDHFVVERRDCRVAYLRCRGREDAVFLASSLWQSKSSPQSERSRDDP